MTTSVLLSRVSPLAKGAEYYRVSRRCRGESSDSPSNRLKIKRDTKDPPLRQCEIGRVPWELEVRSWELTGFQLSRIAKYLSVVGSPVGAASDGRSQLPQRRIQNVGPVAG